MKNIFLIISFFSIQIISAQDTTGTTKNNSVASEIIEKKPEFPGGMYNFYKYIGINFKTPTKKFPKGDIGKVTISFIIDTDGSVTDIKILEKKGYDLEKEIIRVMTNCPKWIPGEENGEKVKKLFYFPFIYNELGTIN